VDSQGRGIAGIEVSALETIQSISEGNTAKRLKATTDQSGEARFSGLDTSLRNSYAVSVEYEGASYPVTPFRSLETIGHRITLPVYPTTNDANEARVGLRGFVYVMMHEGEFVFDVPFRVFSLGEKTWQPQPIELSLPKDAQAIQASEEMPGFVVKDGR